MGHRSLATTTTPPPRAAALLTGGADAGLAAAGAGFAGAPAAGLAKACGATLRSSRLNAEPSWPSTWNLEGEGVVVAVGGRGPGEGARRLDARVERQQIGLERDLVDDADDLADLRRRFGDRVHCRDRLLDDDCALLGVAVGAGDLDCRLLGPFG